jgi:heme O synthase-like polyprenyltransferase
VTKLTKSRLIYLLLIASLFAYFLACFRLSGFNPAGMSDGGGLL